MCQIRVLSNRDGLSVSHCPICQMMFIWHHNILLNFTMEKFSAFHSAIRCLRYEDCCFPFPDQEERAIINTPNPEINFAFTHDEWLDLREVMDEAHYMQEVYALMN